MLAGRVLPQYVEYRHTWYLHNRSDPGIKPARAVPSTADAPANSVSDERSVHSRLAIQHTLWPATVTPSTSQCRHLEGDPGPKHEVLALSRGLPFFWNSGMSHVKYIHSTVSVAPGTKRLRSVRTRGWLRKTRVCL